MAADLWRYYGGLDLRDLRRPNGGVSQMTYRMLEWFIDELPGDSAYKTAVRDAIPDERLTELAQQPPEKHGRWSHEALLLAAMIDRLEMLRRDVVTVNGAKVESPFTPVPRPGVARPKKPASTRNPNAARILRAIAQEHADLHGYSLDDKGFPLPSQETG